MLSFYANVCIPLASELLLWVKVRFCELEDEKENALSLLPVLQNLFIMVLTNRPFINMTNNKLNSLSFVE